VPLPPLASAELQIKGWFIMNGVARFCAVLAVGALAACTNATVEEARVAQPTGSPFTQALTAEYQALAAFEADEMRDWRDAERYANKALRSASGEVVLPEDPAAWDLPPDGEWVLGGSMAEMQDGRARLMTALDGNARDSYPELAARTQARFDCWVEQQEENFQEDDIAACRDEFWASLEELEALIVPAPVAAAEPAMPDIYIVYFDWDRVDIRPDAAAVIADVIGDAASMGSPGISVTGHTDLSGSVDYNMDLSLRRADAVRDALIAGGVAAGQITTAGRGEAEPAVPTADGVREQANRRAEIIIQQ
jgi:OOP family OmpA-OmpF porin